MKRKYGKNDIKSRISTIQNQDAQTSANAIYSPGQVLKSPKTQLNLRPAFSLHHMFSVRFVWLSFEYDKNKLATRKVGEISIMITYSIKMFEYELFDHLNLSTEFFLRSCLPYTYLPFFLPAGDT